jgi:hypothetical protein
MSRIGSHYDKIVRGTVRGDSRSSFHPLGEVSHMDPQLLAECMAQSDYIYKCRMPYASCNAFESRQYGEMARLTKSINIAQRWLALDDRAHGTVRRNDVERAERRRVQNGLYQLKYRYRKLEKEMKS